MAHDPVGEEKEVAMGGRVKERKREKLTGSAQALSQKMVASAAAGCCVTSQIITTGRD